MQKKLQYELFDPLDQQQSSFMNSFYLFFNVGSGGVKGRQFLQFNTQELKIKVDDKDVRIQFFSIQCVASRNQGYERLKQELETVKQLPVVIAGGDGTTMWVIEQMLEQKINIESVILIPLPCGTGNDFSIALGWGNTVPRDLIGIGQSVLKSYISKWNKGHQCFFDIWDVSLQTTDEGSILEVVQTAQGPIKQSLKDLDGSNVNRLEKKMSNYCSIGVDARIGFGFDKVRTTSQFCNKVCYCLQGVQKMFIKTAKVNQVIQFAENYHPETQISKTLFKTNECFEKDAEIIPGNPVTLVCLNINSYSAGVRDIWQNAKNPFNQMKLSSQKTSFSDGLLEFFSFDSIIGIGGERIKPGNATRLAQTHGPLLIKFKESNNNMNTYFQVDGQYYSVIGPYSLEIAPCKQLPNGKIRVLLSN